MAAMREIMAEASKLAELMLLSEQVSVSQAQQ